MPKVPTDKQAKIDGKGASKYGYGYKQQSRVDMQSGLINKVAIAAANETDAQGFSRVCPNEGAVYADKGYCTKPAKLAAAKKWIHLAANKKNNMKAKNKDQHRWYSHISSPYESVFSQKNPRVRYRGIAKNPFSAFMNAITFNLKRVRILQQEGCCLAQVGRISAR